MVAAEGVDKLLVWNAAVALANPVATPVRLYQSLVPIWLVWYRHHKRVYSVVLVLLSECCMLP